MKSLPEIVLGSKSPRRAEIFSFFSLPFKQVSSDFHEESIAFLDNPSDYAIQIATGKALTLQKNFPDALLLTADTVVFGNGKSYGKPANEEEAFSMLKELTGRWHSVYTGVTVVFRGDRYQDVEETSVLFNDLTDEQIRHYIKRIPWSDKAGGYAIQSAGGLIVRRIEGCYYNVMGLPINAVESLFQQVGIQLWNYL